MEIVEQVRQAANIVEIASQYTALRTRGRKHVGLCPFHAEKTPSFTIDADKQLYHCFGCGVGGDVFSLVMEKENLNFPEAVRYLAERYHVPMPAERRLSPEALKLEDQVLKLNESALAFFRKNLHSTAEGRKALDYLRQRQISDAVIEEFKLGYALNVWDGLAAFFRGKGTAPELLEKAGLALPGKRRGEVYDRFRGRVIFPIFTLTGKVVGFGGRTLFDANPKYLNSPDTPVYTKGHLLYGLNFSKDALRAAGEAILVEGYTDFLSLYQAGVKNVVASLGTALTTAQIGLAMRFAPRVVINYDGDAAGRTAASRALPLCFEKGLETRVLVLPENLDPDGFLKKHGPAAYRALLEAASPGIRFLLDTATAGQRMSVPEVKTRVVKGILAVLDNIPDAVIRSEYLRETAECLGLDEAVLRRMIRSAPDEKASVPEDALLYAEKRLLQILIQDKELRPVLMAEIREKDFCGLKSEPILTILLRLLRKEKELIFQELNQELGPGLSRFIHQALQEKTEPSDAEEALHCLNALRIKVKENELKRLQGEIVRLSKTRDDATISALQRQIQDLTRDLDIALRIP